MGAKRQHDKNLPAGIYRVRGRFQIQWQDHGRKRELLKAGTSLKQAMRARERKLIEVEDGTPTQSASSKVTYDVIMAAYNRKLEAAHKSVRHYPALDAAFHGRRAGSITYAVMADYVTARQKSGAADATIHHELTALRAALRHARKIGLVAVVPDFPMPTVSNVREAFFTVDELTDLLPRLPAWLRPAAEFAAWTGWRRANVFALNWDLVDFGAGEVRCPIGTTKSGEPLVFPFKHDSPIADLLRAQERAKRGPYVFHLTRGRKIVTHYKEPWRKAIKAMGPAGLGRQYDPKTGTTRPMPKRWHDLRHTFAELMSRAGVSDTEIQTLGGWKTRAMLDRYRIVNNRDRQLAAVAERDKYVAEQAAKPKVIDLTHMARRAAGGRR